MRLSWQVFLPKRLMASEEEDRIAANEKRVRPVLGDCCESLVKVVFAACIDHVDHMEFKPMRAHPTRSPPVTNGRR
jgi:hypothetical protein